MKLLNKKTGEIGDLDAYDSYKGIFAVETQGGDVRYYYSLAALYEVWEDYEEPKEYYFINSVGGVIRPSDTDDWEQEDAAHHKQIGNYFETKEEADFVVEELKAWKRLKDAGFRFEGWWVTEGRAIEIGARFNKTGIKKDFDLLFGGEE